MSQHDDFMYAVNMTRVILPPRQTLETFGATAIRYHLVSELMDEVNKVRVREGRVFSERPQIVTPSAYATQLLEGFGEKAQDYARWLTEHGQMVQILRYGLQFRKDDLGAETISEPLEASAQRVREQVEAKGDPLTTVIIGADEMWEVSLLKFFVDYIGQSAPNNLRDLQQRQRDIELAPQREIEQAFRDAAADPRRINELGAKLERYGLFEEYEDRFYALVGRS